MQKIIILIIFNLAISCVLFPEIILTKNGNIVKGKILGIDDNAVTINTEYGEITIEKSKINKIYYSEDEYEDDQKINSDKEKSELTEKETEKYEEERKLNNLYYTNYKKLLPLAIGFLSAGGGVNVITLATMTPHVIMNTFNPILLSFYISLNATGLFLDSIGIISLIQATVNYTKWKKNDSGYEKTESSSRYRTLIGVAAALLVPGGICTAVGLGVGIPIFILPLTSGNFDGSYNFSFYSHPGYLSGIGWMSAVLSVGLILDIASIVCFGIGKYQFKKWKKENNLLVDLGYRNNAIFTEIIIKL